MGARKAELEEQGILLDNFTFKDEYPTIQEETYDGYSSRSVSRSALDKVSRKVSDKRQRHLIREVIKSPFDEEDKTDGISPRNSYLEDDELQLLDNQMFNLKNRVFIIDFFLALLFSLQPQMNKEEIYTIRPTRSKLLIVWSILELCTVSLLFAMSFFFLLQIQN